MVYSILIITVTFLFLLTTSNSTLNGLSANYTYLFDHTRGNFTQAIKKCSQLNATVLVIEDAYEDNFIKDNYLMNLTTGIWLGIYDFIGNETNVNYCTNKTLSYYNWDKNYPKNLTNRCSRYSTFFKTWIDSSCSEFKYVVCKVSDKCGSCNCSLPTTSTTTTTTPVISETKNPSQTTSNSVPNDNALTTTTTTQTTSKPLGIWSEWSSWQICILEKKRKLINYSVEIIRSNISCDLICKLFDFLSFH
jgi:hypothetical protein